MKEYNICLSEKILLTIEETNVLTGIGINALRELTRRPNCDFVICVGAKKLIKRKRFEAFLEETAVI